MIFRNDIAPRHVLAPCNALLLQILKISSKKCRFVSGDNSCIFSYFRACCSHRRNEPQRIIFINTLSYKRVLACLIECSPLDSVLISRSCMNDKTPMDGERNKNIWAKLQASEVISRQAKGAGKACASILLQGSRSRFPGHTVNQNLLWDVESKEGMPMQGIQRNPLITEWVRIERTTGMEPQSGSRQRPQSCPETDE